MKIDIYNTNNKYDIIYADPPWKFYTWSDKGLERSAEKHYSTMSIDELKLLPVSNIASTNAVLFLWATGPCLPQAFDLISAWGFTYKTMGFTWVKQNKKSDSLFTGMGRYTRANAEFCLLATRGRPLPRLSHSVKSIILSHIERHSQKPEEARSRIVELFGNISKIELFARTHAENWDCWGNEC